MLTPSAPTGTLMLAEVVPFELPFWGAAGIKMYGACTLGEVQASMKLQRCARCVGLTASRDELGPCTPRGNACTDMLQLHMGDLACSRALVSHCCRSPCSPGSPRRQHTPSEH